MTNQEINERIAKLCGWVTSVQVVEHNIGYQWTENQTWWSYPGLGRHLRPPNYAESLDACLAFEKEYTFGEREEVFDGMLERLGVMDAVFSTPLQRCEAFLRLKGQWDEN